MRPLRLASRAHSSFATPKSSSSRIPTPPPSQSAPSVFRRAGYRFPDLHTMAPRQTFQVWLSDVKPKCRDLRGTRRLAHLSATLAPLASRPPSLL